MDPIRTANVTALVYGMMTAVLATLFAPFVLLVTALDQTRGHAGVGPPALLFLLMIVLYPAMGLIMGWLMGWAGGLGYNFIVRWTGGMLFELDVLSPTPHAAPAPITGETA